MKSVDFPQLITIAASVAVVSEIVKMTVGIEWPILVKVAISSSIILILKVCEEADSWQDW